ncbi:MAG: Rrf2 family transcriptional regulator [Gemmatimonadota bacterium]|nr:Rrf2 family transcriptional regulator [Gemmatimonadota bacterium]
MLSGTAEYALRAVVHLARERHPRKHLRANDLAGAIDVPKNYLSKILHELSRAGVLQSTRGKGGGFRLAVPPEELSLLSIVSLFDQIGERRRCLLGRPECSDSDPCPVHGQWKSTAEQIAAFFRDTTVADVLGAGSLR